MGEDVLETAGVDGTGVTFTAGAGDLGMGEKVGAVKLAADRFVFEAMGNWDKLEGVTQV